jgi:hypothetical protein
VWRNKLNTLYRRVLCENTWGSKVISIQRLENSRSDMQVAVKRLCLKKRNKMAKKIKYRNHCYNFIQALISSYSSSSIYPLFVISVLASKIVPCKLEGIVSEKNRHIYFRYIYIYIYIYTYTYTLTWK